MVITEYLNSKIELDCRVSELHRLGFYRVSIGPLAPFQYLLREAHGIDPNHFEGPKYWTLEYEKGV